MHWSICLALKKVKLDVDGEPKRRLFVQKDRKFVEAKPVRRSQRVYTR